MDFLPRLKVSLPPLPLTDIVVNPKDGAMYFAIGGRNTMSGLYRVTYVGKESTATSQRNVAPGKDNRLEVLFDSEKLRAFALTEDEVQEKIYTNMSERAAAIIKEDLEFMGPVRVKTVEEAQQKIVAVIRRLEDAGQIVIVRGGEDQLV